jgi:hypothetical protein
MTFKELLDHFGSQAAIAKAAGVTHQLVWAWKNADRVPVHWQYEFQDMTGGALKAERLRKRQGHSET